MTDQGDKRPAQAHSFSLCWRQAALVIASADAGLMNRLAADLYRFTGLEAVDKQARPDGGREIFVTAQDSGFILSLPHRSAHLPDYDNLLTELACSLSYMLFSGQEDFFVLHAGAIASPQGAHLLLGPGRIGKSTLTAGLWAAGFDVIGDDYVVITQEHIAPTPKPLKLRLPIDKAMAVQAEKEAQTLSGHYLNERVLLIGRTSPRLASLDKHYRCASLCVVRRVAKEKGTQLRPASKAEMIEAVLDGDVAGPENTLELVRLLMRAQQPPALYCLEMAEGETQRAVTALALAWQT